MGSMSAWAKESNQIIKGDQSEEDNFYYANI